MLRSCCAGRSSRARTCGAGWSPRCCSAATSPSAGASGGGDFQHVPACAAGRDRLRDRLVDVQRDAAPQRTLRPGARLRRQWLRLPGRPRLRGPVHQPGLAGLNARTPLRPTCEASGSRAARRAARGDLRRAAAFGADPLAPAPGPLFRSLRETRRRERAHARAHRRSAAAQPRAGPHLGTASGRREHRARGSRRCGERAIRRLPRVRPSGAGTAAARPPGARAARRRNCARGELRASLHRPGPGEGAGACSSAWGRGSCGATSARRSRRGSRVREWAAAGARVRAVAVVRGGRAWCSCATFACAAERRSAVPRGG